MRDRAEIEADCREPSVICCATHARLLDDVPALLAALDEANTEIERLQARIDGQAWEDLQAENQRLRRALAGHLFDRESLNTREAIRSELIIQGFEAEAAVQRVEALCDEVDGKDRTQEWHDCAPCLVKTDRIRAALAPQDNGDSE
jgi:hypothetical protein